MKNEQQLTHQFLLNMSYCPLLSTNDYSTNYARLDISVWHLYVYFACRKKTEFSLGKDLSSYFSFILNIKAADRESKWRGKRSREYALYLQVIHDLIMNCKNTYRPYHVLLICNIHFLYFLAIKHILGPEKILYYFIYIFPL